MSRMYPATSFVPKQVIDLRKATLQGLSYALTHSKTWPPGFKFYYGDCSTCAMGLACLLWCRIGLHDPHNMTRAFGLSAEQAQAIFAGDYGHTHRGTVTPAMVANRIDLILLGSNLSLTRDKLS